MHYRLTDKITVFKEIPEFGCFMVDDEFQRVADILGLTEWHAAVWIGRLFIMDNDFGEHWFDNWDHREAIEEKAEKLGIDSGNLMIIDPSRFQNGKDGPCHTDEFRTRFWHEVLSGLRLSFGLICDEARLQNNSMLALEETLRATGKPPDDIFIHDLELRIAALELPC